MSPKALKVVVEIKFRAVSCPGVHLPTKDDVYLGTCFMGQYRQSECLPAVFPLLFHEKMTFEKIFLDAVDPGDIAVMLEYEMVRVELVQVTPPVGDTLAYFEEDARKFLFPEPRLVPSFSGVDQEVLMTRAPYFPGIAPRLEFSTKTTISECSAGAAVNIHPNVLMRPVIKRKTKRISRPRTSSAQRRQSDRTDPTNRGKSLPSISRSKSLSPRRYGNTQRMSHIGLGSKAPFVDDSSDPLPMMSSWPIAGRRDSPNNSALFTSSSTSSTVSSSPLVRSSSTVRFSQTGKDSSSSGVFDVKSDDGSSSSETHGPHVPLASSWTDEEQVKNSRFPSASHQQWEEVQERVRGLLTTPQAVRRLLCGASVSEVDRVLARRSISPGPPY
ncbi:spermatogenesis associated 6-like protein [Cynoglossus semilaevis]|uniref:Spermatogenesis associated 6-like n=1 Tax=Cynoglossus semilaevis TaxID=244447 RepID=A0A3P8WML1_CYNSE|nr:spermatogenesis associated 6-like protein [Cynoglossus semilaevis]